MKWFILAIKNYAVIKGRTSREGYWMFILFYILFTIAAIILDFALGTRWGSSSGLIQSLWNLFMLVPGVTIVVRRLHDIGISGKWLLWFLLINLAIFMYYFFFVLPTPWIVWLTFGSSYRTIFLTHLAIAGIINFVPMCIRGTPGANKYGPNPEEIAQEHNEPTEFM